MMNQTKCPQCPVIKIPQCYCLNTCSTFALWFHTGVWTKWPTFSNELPWKKTSEFDSDFIEGCSSGSDWLSLVLNRHQAITSTNQINDDPVHRCMKLLITRLPWVLLVTAETFGLLLDWGWIWHDFPDFKHDDTKEVYRSWRVICHPRTADFCGDCCYMTEACLPPVAPFTNMD